MSKISIYLLRLESFLFYLLIFSIPFQTRIVLRSWGIGFNEWNSAFFYGTDFLIILIFILWLFRAVFKKSSFIFEKHDWFLLGFLLVSAVSIKNIPNRIFGLYQILKLLEFSFLYFYVKSNRNIIFEIKNAFRVFLTSGFFQAILAIIQFLKQADLGLRFLGETVLNPLMSNVAVFIVNGERIMRSYGTLPHPNVLGLILFVSIFIFYWFYIKRERFFKLDSGLILYGVLIFGFLFTFSRVVIFAWLVFLLVMFLAEKNRIKETEFKKIILATVLLLIIFGILFLPYVLERAKISSSDEAVVLRNFYNKVSLHPKPFWGVGIGNFVNWLKQANPGLQENIYQPVHNIYLLVFSETGILGMIMFVLFLLFLIKNSWAKFGYKRLIYRYGVLGFLFAVLFLGFFDHFLLTLQQGRLVFWIMLGLVGDKHSQAIA